VETTAIDDVMGGELEPFIQAYLRQANQAIAE
jgi:peptide chain release factor 2